MGWEEFMVIGITLIIPVVVMLLFSDPKKDKKREELEDKNWERFKNFKEKYPERRFKLIDTYYYKEWYYLRGHDDTVTMRLYLIQDLDDNNLYLCIREFSSDHNLPRSDFNPLYKLVNKELNNTKGSYWSDMDSLFEIEFTEKGFSLKSKDGLTYPKTGVRYKRIVDANHVLYHTNKENDIRTIEKAKLIDAHIEFDNEKEKTVKKMQSN